MGQSTSGIGMLVLFLVSMLVISIQADCTISVGSAGRFLVLTSPNTEGTDLVGWGNAFSSDGSCAGFFATSSGDVLEGATCYSGYKYNTAHVYLADDKTMRDDVPFGIATALSGATVSSVCSGTTALTLTQGNRRALPMVSLNGPYFGQTTDSAVELTVDGEWENFPAWSSVTVQCVAYIATDEASCDASISTAAGVGSTSPTISIDLTTASAVTSSAATYVDVIVQLGEGLGLETFLRHSITILEAGVTPGACVLSTPQWQRVQPGESVTIGIESGCSGFSWGDGPREEFQISYRNLVLEDVEESSITFIPHFLPGPINTVILNFEGLYSIRLGFWQPTARTLPLVLGGSRLAKTAGSVHVEYSPSHFTGGLDEITNEQYRCTSARVQGTGISSESIMTADRDVAGSPLNMCKYIRGTSVSNLSVRNVDEFRFPTTLSTVDTDGTAINDVLRHFETNVVVKPGNFPSYSPAVHPMDIPEAFQSSGEPWVWDGEAINGEPSVFADPSQSLRFKMYCPQTMANAALLLIQEDSSAGTETNHNHPIQRDPYFFLDCDDEDTTYTVTGWRVEVGGVEYASAPEAVLDTFASGAHQISIPAGSLESDRTYRLVLTTELSIKDNAAVSAVSDYRFSTLPSPMAPTFTAVKGTVEGTVSLGSVSGLLNSNRWDSTTLQYYASVGTDSWVSITDPVTVPFGEFDVDTSLTFTDVEVPVGSSGEVVVALHATSGLGVTSKTEVTVSGIDYTSAKYSANDMEALAAAAEAALSAEKYHEVTIAASIAAEAWSASVAVDEDESSCGLRNGDESVSHLDAIVYSSLDEAVDLPTFGSLEDVESYASYLLGVVKGAGQALTLDTWGRMHRAFDHLADGISSFTVGSSSFQQEILVLRHYFLKRINSCNKEVNGTLTTTQIVSATTSMLSLTEAAWGAGAAGAGCVAGSLDDVVYAPNSDNLDKGTYVHWEVVAMSDIGSSRKITAPQADGVSSAAYDVPGTALSSLSSDTDTCVVLVVATTNDVMFPWALDANAGDRRSKVYYLRAFTASGTPRTVSSFEDGEELTITLPADEYEYDGARTTFARYWSEALEKWTFRDMELDEDPEGEGGDATIITTVLPGWSALMESEKDFRSIPTFILGVLVAVPVSLSGFTLFTFMFARHHDIGPAYSQRADYV